MTRASNACLDACAKKQRRAPRPPSECVGIAPDLCFLEVGRQAQEDEATQRVVHLRERVAVTEYGRTRVLSDERRILVEQVVDAEPCVHALEHAHLAEAVR